MRRVASRDGTTIAYDKQGSGPPLILVLGALNKRGSGKKLARALSDHFTVITYDRRGRGDSGDTKPYAVEREIDDFDALIDELGGSARLHGHSSGAVLALLAAQKLGKKVAGLAVYEVPYDRDPAAQEVSAVFKEDVRRLLAEDRRAEVVALFVKSVGVSDKQIAAMRRLPLWDSLAAMAPTLAYDTVEIMNRYPAIDLRTVDVPALVMHGTASPAFMAVTAEALSHGMPNATLRPLEGQTHDVKPDILAAALVTALT